MAEKIISGGVAANATGVQLTASLPLCTFSSAAEIDAFVVRLKAEIDEAAAAAKKSLAELDDEMDGEGD